MRKCPHCGGVLPENASELTERNLRIAQMRQGGARYKDIAKIFGISMPNCRRIFENARKRGIVEGHPLNWTAPNSIDRHVAELEAKGGVMLGEEEAKDKQGEAT